MLLILGKHLATVARSRKVRELRDLADQGVGPYTLIPNTMRRIQYSEKKAN